MDIKTRWFEMVETLITVEEAARLLGVKRQTLYMWVRRGLVPSYRVGKRLIKFKADELLESFKVERSSDTTQPPKVQVGTSTVREPSRALKKAESPEAKKQRERYRAMLGVVK
jgi:excisionase family DNA binding protein